MERKFKVGDRVRDKGIGLDGDVVYVDELSRLPYLVVYKKDSICSSIWREIKKLVEIKSEYDKLVSEIQNGVQKIGDNPKKRWWQ